MLSDHASMPVLAVTDLERARAFYEGTLGFTSAGEVPDGVVYSTSNGGFLVYPSATSVLVAGATVVTLFATGSRASMARPLVTGAAILAIGVVAWC